MRFERSKPVTCDTMVELLGALSALDAAHLSQADDLHAALRARDHARAASLATALAHTLTRLVSTRAALGAHVMVADVLGPAVSLNELALRTSCYVIRNQLEALLAALGGPEMRATLSAWFVGRFAGKGTLELASFLRNELFRIETAWMRFRWQQTPLPGIDETDQEILYHTAMGAGQAAVGALIDEPDVAHFLGAGCDAVWPKVRGACRSIRAVASVQFGRQRRRASRRLQLLPVLPATTDSP